MTTPKRIKAIRRRRPADILDSPEVSRLIDELQETRQTGRPGYPLRVHDRHGAGEVPLRAPDVDAHRGACARASRPRGGDRPGWRGAFSWACYRFTAKLRAHADMLEECIAAVLRR